MRFSILRAFGRDNRANIAVLFALALVPILGFIGAAIDYTIANKQRTKLQQALDLALLAGAAAGKQSLDSGASQSTAISVANTAASTCSPAIPPASLPSWSRTSP
ncbi:pilus assembly protein TadG-related protein [Bradyrhizobium sp. 138]|uniref:TadE/TadG family type IV pilus assembly protein n=1 Tax=Bradyrhizobium sp. 138 TaxID=2782615 RepID=UPI001FF7E881|nr:pilus assembly protein TadG-related protein [Bradyrhizobium sp. 138]